MLSLPPSEFAHANPFQRILQLELFTTSSGLLPVDLRSLGRIDSDKRGQVYLVVAGLSSGCAMASSLSRNPRPWLFSIRSFAATSLSNF